MQLFSSFTDGIETKGNKTGVINDPLGQPTVPAGSDCRLILKFWDGRTYRRTLCVNIVITTGRSLWSASWIFVFFHQSTNRSQASSLDAIVSIPSFQEPLRNFKITKHKKLAN